jgi:hypothetical protein
LTTAAIWNCSKAAINECRAFVPSLVPSVAVPVVARGGSAVAAVSLATMGDRSTSS